MNVPDYTSAERNFYFLYEAFVKHPTANFIVQSFNPDQYSIRSACQMNKEHFYEQDNIFRKINGYPPFGEICVILYKNEIEESLYTKVDTLHKDLLYLKEKYIVRPNEDAKFRESFHKVELMPPILDASSSNEMQKLEASKTGRRELKDIEIYSTPPLIYKMFGKYRYNIILK